MSNIRKIRAHLLVCKHKNCLERGGKGTAKALKRALKKHRLRDDGVITKVKCLDLCGSGPVVVVYPDGVWYGAVDGECADQIVTEHLMEGRVVEKRILHDMRNQDVEGE